MHQDLFLIVFHQFLHILNRYLVILFTFYSVFQIHFAFPSQLLACTLTRLDVAIVTDDPSPASVNGQVAGVPLSLALSLQQLLFLPHLLPVPQKKHSVLQHKVPDDGRKYVNED